jgi:hypothetical protein
MADGTSEVDLGRAATRALGAALFGAFVWAVVGGPLGLTVGLLVIAAFVGWLIGSSARAGSVPRSRPGIAHASTRPATAPAAPRPPAPDAVRWIAVAAAVLAWVLALIAIYLYSLAAIPALPGAIGGGADIFQRIRETSIFTFYAQSFGILDAIEAGVLVLVAWWSSR